MAQVLREELPSFVIVCVPGHERQQQWCVQALAPPFLPLYSLAETLLWSAALNQPRPMLHVPTKTFTLLILLYSYNNDNGFFYFFFVYKLIFFLYFPITLIKKKIVSFG